MIPPMETRISKQVEELEAQWRLREGQWRYKLGRLRLGVEPLGEQLVRYRRVTWALTVVPSLLALMFFTLFGIFGRPDIGLVFVAIVLAPIVLGAWIDYALIGQTGAAYLAEYNEYTRRKAQLEAASARNKSDLGPSLNLSRGRKSFRVESRQGFRATTDHNQAVVSHTPAPTSSNSSASSS